MLVLTRKRNESIWINGDLEIKVLEIRGDQVRLGFEGSKDRYVILRDNVKKTLPDPPREIRLPPVWFEGEDKCQGPDN